MTIQTASTTGADAKKGGCTRAYTKEEVIQTLARQYMEFQSLRRVARECYGGRVTYGDVDRMLDGIEPVKPEKRAAFGLSVLMPAPVCVKCGKVHVTKRCTDGRENAAKELKQKMQELGSHLEREFETLAQRMGIADGMLKNFQFADGRKWAFDFAWPSKRVAVEIEGGIFSGGRHVRGKGYENDCEKYNTAEILGWKLLRFTAGMLKDGRAASQIQKIFSRGDAETQSLLKEEVNRE